MEERILYGTAAGVLKPETNSVTLGPEPYVKVSRQSLETEHRQLLSRLQEVRRLLGYSPLMTGKERRRQE